MTSGETGRFADSGHATDVRDTFVHAVVTQVIRRIDIIDQDARLIVLKVAGDLGRLDSLDDAGGISRAYPLLQDMPRERPIDRPRIHVGKTQSAGKPSRDATFSGGRWAINSDDAMRRLRNEMHDARQL